MNNKEIKEALNNILYDMEYAAFNLCDDYVNKEDSLDRRIVESTCPKISLLLAVRKLKETIKNL